MKEKQTATELEYLKWFRINADFDPAHGDVIYGMHKWFREETEKNIPEGWDDENDDIGV